MSVLEEYLVTPQEAIKISQYRTINDLLMVREISSIYKKDGPYKRYDDPIWYDMCLLGTIFTAGRVQGIREERLKKSGADFV